MKLTIGEFLKERLKSCPNSNSVGWIEHDIVKYYSIEEYYGLIEAIALGMKSLGVTNNSNIAILSQTRVEWNLIDMASLCSKNVVIPIYPTYLSSDIEYILNHSETSILFVENYGQLKKIIAIKDNLKFLKKIIYIDNDQTSDQEKLKEIEVSTLKDLISSGKEKLSSNPNFLNEQIESLEPTDVATIIYTSGTTGNPKGAVITHGAFGSMLQNANIFFKGYFTQRDRTLTFLPLSHVFGRADSMIHLIFNLECVYAESLDKLVDNLAIVKPTIMLAVPRIFEKVYAKIMNQISDGSFIKKSIFHWAKNVSNKYFEYMEKDQAPPIVIQAQQRLAYKLVFSKIYERFGGRVKFFVSGGAPLSVTIIKFLRNAKLNILEGYGLTETIAPCTLNPVYKQNPGTVGLPIGDVEIKFANDGEILLKTTAMFSEYFKNEEATAEVFEDGWFKTGDIGEMTPDGYLKITDRKKDIIITSGGKNIAPQKLENMLKTKKSIAHAMVIGDQKKYLTCIIGIEKEAYVSKFEMLGLSANCTIKELAQHEQVTELIQIDIDKVNKKLAKFETIKKFYIAPAEFSVDGGELTPSLKLKKKVLLKRYETSIAAMYQG